MATIHPNQTARDLAKEVGAERAWSIAKGLREPRPMRNPVEIACLVFFACYVVTVATVARW